MPATDLESVFDIAEEDLVAVVFGLHPGKPGQANQRIAMDAVKAIAKLDFKILERVLD